MPNAKIKKHHYSELGDAVGPYVHAVEHQNVLYTSGFTAFGSSAQKQGIDEQLRVIYKQIETVALDHRETLASLIKVTIYITNTADIPTAREALIEIYNGHYPASSLVQVAGLFHPDLLVEVDATIAL
ncbi:enamine deaminase RidA [Vibrio azureus]|uniref:Uncharacterized protein n=1 Tax=Vibrio azureus NBRC 104587 TaxID=1219077 RepID=U3ATP5_9VIBR|nr:RidA family protein [Vibrio azureus]AUI87737.1 enamine deaminase RidA [Vibrio azureus]GAD76612.1 hypothetical protein VAZ01S_048_00190 [Vibrio azureus NBRC 104587]